MTEHDYNPITEGWKQINQEFRDNVSYTTSSRLTRATGDSVSKGQNKQNNPHPRLSISHQEDKPQQTMVKMKEIKELLGSIGNNEK